LARLTQRVCGVEPMPKAEFWAGPAISRRQTGFDTLVAKPLDHRKL
jgi:hypothetical protein